MTRNRKKDAGGGALFLRLVFFLFFFVFLKLISVARRGYDFFFLFFFVGDYVQMDRMDLQNLELDIALRASEDFAFLDFVLVHVNFGVAFRTSNHGRFSLGAKSATESVLYNVCVKQ